MLSSSSRRGGFSVIVCISGASQIIMIQIGMPCSPSTFGHFLSNPKPSRGLLSRSISPSSPLPPDWQKRKESMDNNLSLHTRLPHPLNASSVIGSLANFELMKCRLNLWCTTKEYSIPHWHWFSARGSQKFCPVIHRKTYHSIIYTSL